MVSLRPFLATDWPVPPGSGLFGLFFLFRFFGGGDLLGAVQECAQRHPAEHISMRLLNELHQLADVAVQTLGKKRVAKQVRVRDEWCAKEKTCQRKKKTDCWDRESGRHYFQFPSDSVCVCIYA